MIMVSNIWEADSLCLYILSPQTAKYVGFSAHITFVMLGFFFFRSDSTPTSFISDSALVKVSLRLRCFSLIIDNQE